MAGVTFFFTFEVTENRCNLYFLCKKKKKGVNGAMVVYPLNRRWFRRPSEESKVKQHDFVRKDCCY